MAKAFQRSYKFLPEVLQTALNRRFLTTTMDQLIVPGDARQLNYYVGRKYSRGAKSTDKFLPESTDLRSAYQLEVGAAVQDPDGTYSFGSTVEDFINALSFYGVDKSTMQEILADDFRPADFKIDLDKLVNYDNYYWVPDGPDIVTVNFSEANKLYIKFSTLTNLSGYYDSTYWYISANNATDVVDAFPNASNSRAVVDRTVNYKLPITPQLMQTQNQVSIPAASMVGVSVNGHPFYTYTMGSKETYNSVTYTINTVFVENTIVSYVGEAVKLSNSFDSSEDLLHKSTTEFAGHPDIDGIFHYHAFTSELGDSTSGHSKILGYAFDGFPIYGPRGYANADGSGGIVYMTSSYQLKADTAVRGVADGRYVEDYEYVAGLGNLDSNNGRYTVTPEYPNGTYAYFLTVDSLSGDPLFPYVLGPKWSGNPIQQAANIEIPMDATEYTGIPTIDIERNIIGSQRFSIGNINFLNGLKVRFDSTAIPASYRNKDYYVEGVGSAIELVPVDELVSNGLEAGTVSTTLNNTYDSVSYDVGEFSGLSYGYLDKHYVTIARNSQDRNAWSRSNRWVHYRTLEHVSEILDSPFVINHSQKAVRPIIEFVPNMALYNHARNNIAIVDAFDQIEADAFSNIVGKTSYTVNGVTLEDGMKIVFAADQDTQVRSKVYLVNIPQVDEGRKVSYTPDPIGVAPFYNTSVNFVIAGNFAAKDIEILHNGNLLIAGVDYVATVLTNSLDVELTTPVSPLSGIEVNAYEYESYISLTEIAAATDYSGVVVKGSDTTGSSARGQGYYYLNDNWIQSQAKTEIFQQPLFDLFDKNLDSIGDRSIYVGSTFIGNQLFSYKEGTGATDTELGIPLSYRAVGLKGDILFEWDHSIDSFNFTLNAVTTSLDCESFYTLNTKDNSLRGTTLPSNRLTELPAMDLRYINVATNTIDLKVSSIESSNQQTTLVELNDKTLYRGVDYDIVNRVDTVKTVQGDKYKKTVVNGRLIFRSPLAVGDKLLITQWTNDDISNTDLTWKLPLALRANPANTKITNMTYGELGSHLVSGAIMIRTLDGSSIGKNNLYLQPSLANYCAKFGYHNGNILMAMALLKNRKMGFVQSLEYSRNEFTRFKNYLIQQYEIVEFDEDNIIPSMVDNLIYEFGLGKTSTSPFYNSDMIPGSTNYIATTYDVRFSEDKTYPLGVTFSDDETSRRAVLVYHNGNLLTRYVDYDFDATASFTINSNYALVAGDTILVREYDTTTENWIPVTPAKLGLAPAHVPAIITVQQPSGSRNVIRGHDGSLTPVYNDQRDDILLEVEKRIYNNIKQASQETYKKILNIFSPLPGKYRSSELNFDNYINIVDRSFGQWILRSRLSYTTNSTYDSANGFTWNYRGQRDRYGSEVRIGSWFGLYRHYFDTPYPNKTPWEMLGFHEEPTWWEDEYGVAPYTKQNDKLWTDLEQGLIRQGSRAGVDSRYKRTVDGSTVKLKDIIPVDDHGNLLSPIDCTLVSVGNARLLTADWIFGDCGPVEQAWIRSSEFEFARQMYMSLNNPSLYFGTAFDLLDLQFNSVSGLIEKNYNTTITTVSRPIRHTDIESSSKISDTSGYFVWIKARADATNIDQTEFQNFIAGVQPRLLFRMTGYTDKDKLQMFINSVAPGSQNAQSLLPDNNYQIILDQSVPTKTLTYSGVAVTRTNNGWKIEGYDTDNSYFYVLPSKQNAGEKQTVIVGETSEEYYDWAPGFFYVQGQIVKYKNIYYKVLSDHTSDLAFTTGTVYSPLQELPTVGGIKATLWTTFDTTPVKIYYGTTYRTQQEVFDFLIAYGRYLEDQGFIFDQFDSDLTEVRNWLLAGKEFLFWSLQNWSVGSSIALSPSGRVLQMYVPQGDLDPFYGPYSDPNSVLDQNGQPLRSNGIVVDRNFDVVTVGVIDQGQSIYLLKSVVSDTDHMVVFDNKTDFNDIVFDPTTGARQDRLIVRGSKSNGWNGKLFAPGFTLDQANIAEWAAYTDYSIGDLVDVRNITYCATENHNSGDLFDYSKWKQLVNQPSKFLQQNLDSLANRIEQFYDLSVDQITSDVSLYARHLTGFQNRDYLADLLVNDETQFKFYQGMITQKGTERAVSKLLRGLGTNGNASVDLKDEWALRLGEFGLADNTDEVEVNLTSDDLEFSKIMLDFSGNNSNQKNIVSIGSDKLLDKGERVLPNLFPVAPADLRQKIAGYARLDHVDATVLNEDLLSTVSTEIINVDGSIIWVAKTASSNSKIYRTKRFGPFDMTILANDVISLDNNISLNEGEKVWFLPTTSSAFSGTAGAIEFSVGINGYQVINTVESTTRFTLVESTGLEENDLFNAFIIKLIPVEYDSFNTVYQINIAGVTNDNPAVVTTSTAHEFIGGERIFIDNVAGMTELNAGIYYVGYVSSTKFKLYADPELTLPTNSQTYTTYASGGVVYSSHMAAAKVIYDSMNGERIWADDYINGWAVFKKQEAWNNIGVSGGLEPISTATLLGTAMHAWSYRSINWLAAQTTPVVTSGRTNDAVLVYERSEVDAVLNAPITIRGYTASVSAGCDFGFAISNIGENSLVIGCPLDAGGGTNRGAVQIWTRGNSGGWAPKYTVYANTPVNNAKFGGSIARVNDNVVLIGAPGEAKVYRLIREDSFSVGITAITTTAPGRVTVNAATHGLSNGQLITISGNTSRQQSDGSTLNQSFYVKKYDADQFDLYSDEALTVPVSVISAAGISLGTVNTSDTYRIIEEESGLTGFGTSIAADSNKVAISDTAGNGHVNVYTVSDTGELSTFSTITGTAAVPIKSQHPIDITVTNGDTHVAVGSRFTTYDVFSTTLDGGSTTFDSLVVDGAVRIFKVTDSSYTMSQILTSPLINGVNTFGKAIKFTANGKLVVGNPSSPYTYVIAFDTDTTIFDDDKTVFQDLILDYGVTESYGYYNDQYIWESSVPNPVSAVVDPSTGFGTVLTESNNTIFVASPWNSSGRIFEYQNTVDGWGIDSQQEDLVDVTLVNRALTYDPVEDKVISFLNQWDPVKNFHDSDALINLDHIAAQDPGLYQENSPGNSYWAEEKVGTLWWNNSTAIWLWYEQGELSYRLSNWGRLFPGAEITVSEWVESSVTPSNYNVGNTFPEFGQPPLGANQPYNVKVVTDSTGARVFKYYFWVANTQVISLASNKTMSAASIASSILNGPYKWIAAAGRDSLVTQNLREDLVNGNHILQVELLRSSYDSPRHVEWMLLSEDDDRQPPTVLVDKMIDSLTGKNILELPVPDLNLAAHKKLGTKIRPCQTMFNDRVAAIQISSEYLNDRLSEIILENIDLGALNAVDPEPLQSEIVDIIFDDGITVFDDSATSFISYYANWDETVPTYADIIQDDLVSKDVGYKILVENDETRNDFWSVYDWSGSTLDLTKVQRYDTTRYWSRVDYYSSEYPIGSVPAVTVSTEQELLDGDYAGLNVKVLGPGYWRVLKKDANNEVTILAMQNGTIRLDITEKDFNTLLAFDTSSFDAGTFDPEPTIELRNILDAMHHNIFVGERRSTWNSWFFRMVRHALSEQRQLDWAFKSSFIRVKHNVAALDTRPIYSLDIDTSLENYIKEVKPYHTKIREYTSVYDGQDTFDSLTSDFDCPPHLDGTRYVVSNVQDTAQESLFENKWPWRNYRDNRGYEVISVIITNGGSGYVSEPTITLSGGTTLGGLYAKPATARAILGVSSQNYNTIGDENYFSFRKVWVDKQHDRDRSIDNTDLPGDVLASLTGTDAYAIKRIEILTSGMGYLTPPTVTISGGGGTGATAYAVLGKTPTRMFKTGLKFDRVQGTASILYSDVRSPDLDNPGFDEWHAADRIAAWYQPQPGQPGVPERISVSHYYDGSTTVFDLPQQFMYEELLTVVVNGTLLDPAFYTVYPSNKTVDIISTMIIGSNIELILNPPLLPLMLGADFDRTKLVGPKFGTGPGFDAQSLGFDSLEFDSWELDPLGNLVEAGGIDTYLEGGRFGSVTGYDPSQEVRSDGSDFLNEQTIPSTEELINGQIFDTVDIKVFTDPGLNQPVSVETFTASGDTTFPLQHVPDSTDNITVFVNGLVQSPTAYTLDYSIGVDSLIIAVNIVFTIAPAAGSIVTSVVTTNAGPDIEQVQNFVGNGTTTQFRISNVGAANPLRDAIVVVDGIKTAHTFTNDGNDLVFTVSPAPVNNAAVRIIVYMQVAGSPTPVLKNYAESFMQNITMTGASTYTLTYPPGELAPTSASTIVYVARGNTANASVRVGQRLVPPDTAYYLGDGIETVFNLPDCPGFSKVGLLAAQVQVVVDGTTLTTGSYSIDVGLDIVTITGTAPSSGAVVTVTVLTSGDYWVSGSTLNIRPSVIQTSLGIPTRLLVNTYNDTAVTEMRTEVFGANSALHIYYTGFGVYGYGLTDTQKTQQDFYSRGQLRLSMDVKGLSRVSVFKNGVFLIPGQGWNLQEGTTNIINVAGGVNSTDKIVVHYFAGSETTTSFGFRIFKDMLGRVNYYRIAAQNSAITTQTVTTTSTTIYLTDTSGLQDPGTKPGVIMLGKERIEYFQKTATTISQLRRGTRGTGATIHPVGTLAVDLGQVSEMPQSDTVKKTTYYGDDSTISFSLPLLLSTAEHDSNCVRVYVGGKLVATSAYTVDVTGANYDQITFSTAPKSGLRIVILIKQSANWYDVTTTALGLDSTNTIWAKFIREKPTVLDIS